MDTLPRFVDALLDAIDCIRSFSILRPSEVSVQVSVICIYVVLQVMFPDDGPQGQSVNGKQNWAQLRPLWMTYSVNVLRELWPPMHTV